MHQLGERAHERLVVLHPAGRVNEHRVIPHRLRVRDAVGSDLRRVVAVPLLEEGHVERLGVNAQLLDGAGAESVASAEERHETVRLDVVGNLGERGALADAVDAHKHHHVRPLAAARRRNVVQQVDAARWGEHAPERLRHRRLDGASERAEGGERRADQRRAHRFDHLGTDLLRHVLLHQPVEQRLEHGRHRLRRHRPAPDQLAQRAAKKGGGTLGRRCRADAERLVEVDAPSLVHLDGRAHARPLLR
mmetsp:Transcript_46677/g.151664  ORF Transcript_46677/g.151664 Transcript_46677/m.151664 type:complete len:248 (+) Transcript_46677:410-1153(+)